MLHKEIRLFNRMILSTPVCDGGKDPKDILRAMGPWRHIRSIDDIVP